MTVNDAHIILAMIRTIYPREQTEAEGEMEAKLWSKLFPEPVQSVTPAVMQCMRSMHYEPKPADIRERMSKNLEDPNDTPERAWTTYREALRGLSGYSDARAAWIDFPPKIQAITTPSEMKDHAFNFSSVELTRYVKPQFMKAYAEQGHIRHAERLQIGLNEDEARLLAAKIGITVKKV